MFPYCPTSASRLCETSKMSKLIIMVIEEGSDDDLAAWADESTAKVVEVVVNEMKEEPQTEIRAAWLRPPITVG